MPIDFNPHFIFNQNSNVQQKIVNRQSISANGEGGDTFVKRVMQNVAPTPYDGIKITDEDREIIFTNLVDTDMLFGHRNDAKGYGHAIEEIDDYLATIYQLSPEESDYVKNFALKYRISGGADD